MFRYVIFIWNDNDAAQFQTAEWLSARLRSTSEKWTCILERPGVRVYCIREQSTSMEVYRLPDAGVILGVLFKRTLDGSQIAAQEKIAFDEQAAARIIASDGRELISAYWGNYVAVLHDQNHKGARVLRGPASSLPCFRMKHSGVEVCFSFMEDCVRLDLCRFSINWEYIAMDMLGRIPTEHVTIALNNLVS